MVTETERKPWRVEYKSFSSGRWLLKDRFASWKDAVLAEGEMSLETSEQGDPRETRVLRD